MIPTWEQILKKVEELGGHVVPCTDKCTNNVWCLIAPVGKVWVWDGCHEYRVQRDSDKSRSYCLTSIKRGVKECTVEDCMYDEKRSTLMSSEIEIKREQ